METHNIQSKPDCVIINIENSNVDSGNEDGFDSGVDTTGQEQN